MGWGLAGVVDKILSFFPGTPTKERRKKEKGKKKEKKKEKKKKEGLVSWNDFFVLFCFLKLGKSCWIWKSEGKPGATD